MIDIDMAKPRQIIEEAIDANDLPLLLKLCGMLHGHFCPGVAMGIKASVRAVKELSAISTGMEEVIAIVETNSCYSDGVQLITGCSFGNNALIYRDFGRTALTLAKRSGEAVRVSSKPDGLSLDRREPEAKELFQKVVTRREGTEADEAKLKELWAQVSLRVLDIPDEELFNVSRVTIQLPSYAPIFPSALCSVCGESIMEPRARVKDGNVVCLACAGHDYFQLTGAGLSLVSPGSNKD